MHFYSGEADKLFLSDFTSLYVNGKRTLLFIQQTFFTNDSNDRED